MPGAAEGGRIAGWYFKSVEAAIFATAASQGVTQGLSVGAGTSSSMDSVAAINESRHHAQAAALLGWRNVNELAIFDMDQGMLSYILVYAAHRNDALAPADRGFAVPVAGGSTLLAVYSANASAVVLAFAGTNQTLVNVTSNNPLEDPAFFKGAFSEQGNGSVDPVLADPFAGRVGSGHEGLYWVRRWLSSHQTWLVCERASSQVCSSSRTLSEAPHERVVTTDAPPGQHRSACGRSATWHYDCRTAAFALCCRHCRAWLLSSHLPDWSSHDSAAGPSAPRWSLSLQALQVLECLSHARPISVLIV